MSQTDPNRPRLNHWTTAALCADSEPHDLVKMLGALVTCPECLGRMKEARIYLDRRQRVILAKEQ